MSKAFAKLRKLRGRSFDELRRRGAQALSAYAERAGVSPAARVPADAEFVELLDASKLTRGCEASAEGLLAHFRARTSPRFFAPFGEREVTVARWRALFGASSLSRLTERADAIARGRFDLLGLRGLSFGDPPDWHLEPVAGRRAPLAHWSRIDYLDSAVAGDKKIVWELNRQQYFMTLGRAYWLTCDERYAQVFASHLESWMEANPPKLGINWASSLEIAFRSISWLWALHFFKDSPHLRPALFLRALKLLYLNARHLETYLSTYFSPNTHLTGEALGLFYIGTLLPELRDAARWRETGKRILLEQLGRHVLADGVYFEQSSYYHRYTTDFYTHLLVLARANGEKLSDQVEPKLSALLDHLMHVTRPDGTTPLFGDDDGGRLVVLDERPMNDFRAALSTGAAIFGRADYKHVARELVEETFWLLGAEGVRAFDELEARPPAERARAFEAGGYYCARDQWDDEASFLLVDCGPHGAVNAAHAHADALSFEFAARGRALLVDPGTYTYTGDASMRDYFRGSSAHNTLVINGESSSSPSAAFAWHTVARARARRWLCGERFTYFEGSHDGYERLASPAAHTRAFLFLRARYLVVRDRVETAGEHAYELFFHFAPGASTFIDAGDGETESALRERGSPGLSIHAAGARGAWRVEDGWVSKCYGSRERAPVGVFSFGGKENQELYTFLLPEARAASGLSSAREAEAKGGRAFVVFNGRSARDLLLVKSALVKNEQDATVEARGCESDFEWCWLSVTRETDALRGWALVGEGRRLARGGRELFRSKARVNYAAAERVGDELMIEIDAATDFEVAPEGARRVSVNGRRFEVGGAAEVARFEASAGRAYVLVETRLGADARGELSELGEEAYVRD